jgi:hypothetical protein
MWGDEMNDTRRIDWLESTCHQIIYDPDRFDGDMKTGSWWCVDRTKAVYNHETEYWDVGWVERPVDETIRGAIDAAIKEVEEE